MSDPTPHSRHADDARADDAPPTDVVSDEVKEDAAASQDFDQAASEESPEQISESMENGPTDRPAQTHP